MHLLIRFPISFWRGFVLINVSLIAAPLPAQTLKELQSQLEIAKTQLALADTRLELLKRQQQLAEVRTGGRPAETPPLAAPYRIVAGNPREETNSDRDNFPTTLAAPSARPLLTLSLSPCSPRNASLDSSHGIF